MSTPTTIEGMAELIRKLENPQWAAKPAGEFLDRWRFGTQRDAVANMKRGPGGWVDTGGTRQSMTSERDQSAFPLWAKVGSNKMTARWGEYGTGALSEDPESSHRPYRPPGPALEKWALKHGFASGWVVSDIIFRQGGTKPRRFLRNAAQTSEGKIAGWLGQMAAGIEAEASRA